MRRTIKISIAAAALLAAMCTGAWAAVTAKKTTDVRYLEDGVERTTPSGKDVYIIDSGFEFNNTDNMDNDWYVVSGDVTCNFLYFENADAVDIILADGAMLDTHEILTLYAPLTIYAQSTDRDKMGAISANLVTIGTGTVAAIRSASHLTIHGGWIRARSERTSTVGSWVGAYALRADDPESDITVGAGAIVEAECIAVSGGSAGGIFADGDLISSGDVTARSTASAADRAIAILANTGTAKIVGGVCRATATGKDGSAGIEAGTKVAVKGGWVESAPKIPDATTKDHTDGALIDGDEGTVKGTAVIPAGMTATLPDGAAMTVEDGAHLTVEPGATFDASKGTLDNKGKIENDGTLKLPETMSPEEIKALGITGRGEIFKGAEPVTPDGTKDHRRSVVMEKSFGDASSAWTPEDGDWEIVISMDSELDIKSVSIDGTVLKKDADWSIKAAQTGDLSAKAESPRTVVISARTLSSLVDETASKDHALRITMTDDGYAELTFWVGTEKLPNDDDPTRRGSSGACSAGSGLAAIAALAMVAARKRSK